MKSNPVGWFEIYVNDLERAAKFYEAVFETDLQELPFPDSPLAMRAFPMSVGVSGSSGALVHCEGVAAGRGGTLVYFSCKDCAVEGSRVEAAGGKIQREKMSIGDFGFIVLAEDPDGNMIGLHSNA